MCGLEKGREGGWRDVVHKYINFYFQFWIIIHNYSDHSNVRQKATKQKITQNNQ